MKELSLSEIWIYPIKSLGGVRLTTTTILPKGLQYDRRWMLIDAEGVFMTQRVYPAMALFKLNLEHDHLHITHRDHSIKIPLSIATEKKIATKVWDDTVTTLEADSHYSDWFSDQLGTKCKLVYFPEHHDRPVDPAYNVNDDHVSLADGYPFLIIGQSSLNDLNNRLSEPLPMNRFRPNFVFTGGEPYEEDEWRNFSIGTNKFVGVKPCSRCVMTTVNQDTAAKGAEPLKTLATYRRRNNKIYFGQNVIALDHGEVSVGDKILLN